MDHNPLIQLPPNPFQFQHEQQQKVRDEAIELQRLCYEVFHMSDTGKKLYTMLQDKYVIPARFSPHENNASNLALYWEGFKEAIRGLHDQGLLHAKRVNEGGKR